jgi:predicted DCC family thiol-disulfide oxidoreductase YuxK
MSHDHLCLPETTINLEMNRATSKLVSAFSIAMRRNLRLAWPPAASIRSLKPGSLPGPFCRYQSNDAHPSPCHLRVWWDASCPLCSREISLMRRLDAEKRILFIPTTKATQSTELPAPTGSTCPVDKQTLFARFYAEENDHDVVDGAAAFTAMWRQIPQLRWLGNAARNGAVLWMLERLYRAFLVVRPGMQWLARKVDKRGVQRGV